jgi:hypothetical protein
MTVPNTVKGFYESEDCYEPYSNVNKPTKELVEKKWPGTLKK